jgi:two-component system, OmpR family, alkaline phosphatase synthesis response regulator PhoP
VPTILVVDDEPHIVDLAKLYLQREGFRVETVGTGKDALERVNKVQPALVVLDVMLPDLDGFEVCRRIRKQSDVPILMLTARGDDTDKIVGLEIGADDYMTKPFNPRELAARVKAVLRRYEAGQRPATVLEAGDLRLDIARREATVAGSPIALRTKEFDLLAAFLRNRNIVLTREQLLEIVWGYDFLGESRTVDVHITHVREKISGSHANIETVRGVGYRLVAEG